MTSWLVRSPRSGSSGSGSSFGRGHCGVFLGNTLNSHSASLFPGVQMGIGEFNAGFNPGMDWHPIQGGVEILLVASCHRDKCRPDGSLGLKADLTYLWTSWNHCTQV